MSERIGFVGVGRMGANMARGLKECGYTIAAVYDVRSESAEALAQELGAEACSMLPDVTALSDVIIHSCHGRPCHAKITARKGDSLLTGAKGRSSSMRTVSPKIQIEVERLAEGEGRIARSVHARASRRPGRLALPDVRRPGRHVQPRQTDPRKNSVPRCRYVGKAGQAPTSRRSSNMVMNINTAGLAEGLALGSALRVDLTLYANLFANRREFSRFCKPWRDMQTGAFVLLFRGSCLQGFGHRSEPRQGKRTYPCRLAVATKKQYDA